ncbi:transmembrane protein 14A isoform X2 [Struthio camelus]|uniref:transmembrane protein 14A isoform X2 n=1 Tax=Struthio camelus TaxID=8801 RepID=UPI00051E36ED|nr:PREDICTED: transmembrane protein 14A isoform X2 [Struthio camelus australis]
MAIDWIGFAYAALVAVGGVLGYTRKGSKISLAAGLTFGSVAGYGAYCVTRDPRNVKISLFSAFLLTVIMGMRFKRSKKLLPAGLVACLRGAAFKTAGSSAPLKTGKILTPDIRTLISSSLDRLLCFSEH